MRTINFILLLSSVVIAATSTIHVCNDRTCFDQKIEAARYEWMKTFNGERFLRVYAPDGSIVDITGRDLKIELRKNKEVKHPQSIIKRKHK